MRNLGSTRRQRWIAGAKLPPALKAPSACFQVCLKSSQHSPIAAANLASSPHVRATNTQKKLHPLVSISILSTSSLSKTQSNINPHPHPCSNISDVRARILATSSTLATPSTTNNAQLRQGSVLPEQHGDHTKISQTPPTTSNPQRPTNPNNQITHASHPFSPNATRAIEQGGLGGPPHLVSKIIPQREGFLLFSDLTPQGRRPRVGQPERDEGLVPQSFRRGAKSLAARSAQRGFLHARGRLGN